MGSDRLIPRLEIRAATPADIETIASILYQSFAEFEPLYTPGAFAATTPGCEQILDRWSEGPVWVAICDGAVVGTVAAVPKRDSLYVRSMAIIPAARGQNIGRCLLQAVEAYAREQGCQRLYLSTTPFLRRAIELYERYGFRKSSEGPRELFGTPLFTMEKLLEDAD